MLVMILIIFLANNQTTNIKQMLLYIIRMIMGIAVVLFFIKIASAED